MLPGLLGASLFGEGRGTYEEAEPLLHRALNIREKTLGDNFLGDLDIAHSLKSLALLYRYQSRFEEAEPLLHRALDIIKKRVEDDNALVAVFLGELTQLYYYQGRYEEAKALCKRSLDIYDKAQDFGEEIPDFRVGQPLNTLGRETSALNRPETPWAEKTSALNHPEGLWAEKRPL